MKKSPSQQSENAELTLRRRMVGMGGVIICAFSCLSWRMVHLQIDQHTHYTSEVKRKLTTTVELPAHRGAITDSRGQVLAEDVPVQQIGFDIGFLRYTKVLAGALAASEGSTASDILKTWNEKEIRHRYIQRVATALAPHLGMSVDAVEGQLLPKASVETKDLRGEIMLQREVPVQTGIAIRETIEQQKLGVHKERLERVGGVIVREAYARRYPHGDQSAWFSGRYGYADDKPTTKASGINGIEKQFNAQLAGKAGFRDIEVDGAGNEIPFYRGDFRDSADGQNLRTAYDLGLSKALEQVLDKTVTADGYPSASAMRAKQIIAIFFEPKTMALRAVVQRSYEDKDKQDIFTNHAVQYLYEPGSTIKIATTAIGLSKNAVTPKTVFTIGTDRTWIDPSHQVETIFDSHSDEDGTASVADIFIHSSNIGSYFIARKVGRDAYRQALSDFGFWKKTGIEMPAERFNEVRKSFRIEDWTPTDMSRVAYGYGVMVSPAQVCAMLGTILNDGVYRPLSVTEAWTDAQGKFLKPSTQAEGRTVATTAACKALRAMMLTVVEEGTGKPARSNQFEIAGKTGTANKLDFKRYGKDGDFILDKKGRKIPFYNKQKQVCSFVGYLSAHDGPQLAGLVIVDEPKLSEEMRFGGKTAAPIFRRMAEAAMNYYRVAPLFTAAQKAAPPAP